MISVRRAMIAVGSAMLAGTARASQDALFSIASDGYVALLQTQSDQLIRQDQKTKNPGSAYESANSNVNALQARISQVNEQMAGDAESRAQEHEKKLQAVNADITEQRSKNERIQADISALDASIERYHRMSQTLVEQNTKLRKELKLIQANISLAQEFAQQTLNDTFEPPADTAELRVLSELAEQDAVRNAEKAHQEQLHSLEKAALMQVHDKPHNGRKYAHELLNGVQDSIDAMIAEHNASQAKLDETFDKELSKLNDTLQELVAEEGRLSKEKASKQETEQRVIVALEHLRNTGKQLSDKTERLLSFAGALSSMPNPLGEDPTNPQTLQGSKSSGKRAPWQKALGLLR